VILFNLGTEGQPVAVTRGNLAVFLTLTSLSFLPQLWLQGLLPVSALWLGIVLLVPYGIGTGLGTCCSGRAGLGSIAASPMLLIGAAGLAALPIWG
jgi:hypothetical protein